MFVHGRGYGQVRDRIIQRMNLAPTKSSILRRLPKWVVQPVAQSVKSIVPAFCKSSLPKEVLVVDRILTYMSVAFSIFPW